LKGIAGTCTYYQQHDVYKKPWHTKTSLPGQNGCSNHLAPPHHHHPHHHHHHQQQQQQQAGLEYQT
jgi:hypothetical protein